MKRFFGLIKKSAVLAASVFFISKVVVLQAAENVGFPEASLFAKQGGWLAYSINNHPSLVQLRNKIFYLASDHSIHGLLWSDSATGKYLKAHPTLEVVLAIVDAKYGNIGFTGLIHADWAHARNHNVPFSLRPRVINETYLKNLRTHQRIHRSYLVGVEHGKASIKQVPQSVAYRVQFSVP